MDLWSISLTWNIKCQREREHLQGEVQVRSTVHGLTFVDLNPRFLVLHILVVNYEGCHFAAGDLRNSISITASIVHQ